MTTADFPDKSNDWMTLEEAAAYMGVSTKFLAQQRYQRTGPPFHRLSPRKIIYFKSEVDSWVRSN